MLISTNTAFANAMRKLVTALQPWSNRSVIDSDLPRLTADNERLFWQERQFEATATLKSVLLLSSMAFIAFIFLDLYKNTLTDNEFLSRFFIVITYLLLFNYLHTRPLAEHTVSRVVKIASGFYVLNLLIMLVMNQSSLSHGEVCTHLLPIYFFIYGQLFMTIMDTVLFGWFALFVFAITAYVTGTTFSELMPSILILCIANLFGFCTRYQLEYQYRVSFRAKYEAVAMAAEKSQFIQQLSHNLRQPLQALSSFASILEANCSSKTHDRLPELACRIGNTTDELNRAFNHILHIANLEAGKQLPYLKSVDINLILAALEDQYAAIAVKRNLKLKVKLRTKPPFHVYSDACMLSQIIGNLMDNAIKYTNKGWVLVTTVKTQKGLKLVVCDSGIGITEKDKPNIFNEFYRGSWYRRSNDTTVQGHGIGLTYVQSAINNLPSHGLRFNTQVNVGSCFQLQLPITAQTSAHPDQMPVYLSGAMIFIIDDNQQVLTALAEQLDMHGGSVYTATDKADALTQLSTITIKPDLVISDFYLDNDETAHDIIAAVHGKWSDVPILIFSAHAISDKDKARFPANSGILRKPASQKVLLEKMVTLMANAKNNQSSI